MSKPNEKYEIPTILYEEPQRGLKPNPIPYIEVAQTSRMPPVLYIFEYKRTGEYEPGTGELDMEIVDQIPHMYADMEHLKEKLPPHLNDMVRVLLGLKPLAEAQKAGQAILDKVVKSAETFRQQKLANLPETNPSTNKGNE